MDSLQCLTTTIAEVVNAPYPVSLAKLSRILTQTSETTLDVWCLIKACQADHLIAHLTYRLKYDVEAISCLMDLIQCRGIRATIAQNQSMLIARFCPYLDQEPASPRTLHICSSMLHLCLDSDLPVPKALIDTVNRISATQGALPGSTCVPDRSFAESILTFISSSPISVLSQLDEVTIENSTNLWKQLLRSATHRHAVAALYVAHRLAKHADSIKGNGVSSATKAGSELLFAWIEKASSLFKGAKAANVLDTMILVILKASSQLQGQGLDMFDVALRCQEVICDLHQSVLKAWSANNMSIVTKLRTKCLQNHDIRFQMMLYQILEVLYPDLSFSLLDSLLSGSKASASTLIVDHNCSIIPKLVEKLMSAVDSDFKTSVADGLPQECLRRLIKWLLIWCTPGRNVDDETWCATELAINMIDNLIHQIDARSQVAGLIVDLLLEAGIATDWWQPDPVIPGLPTNCAYLPVCLHRLEQRRQTLCSRTSLLLLQAASTSDRMLQAGLLRRLEPQLTRPLLANPTFFCQYPIILLDQYNFSRAAEPGELGNDWRNSLREHILDSNSHTWDKIESAIHQICGDLESRCDNVEKPLQEARKEASVLRDRLIDAEQQHDTARADAARQSSFAEKEKAAKEECIRQAQRLEIELAAVNHDLEQYQRQILDIRATLECAEKEYAQSIADCKTSAERDTSELRQTFATRISELEDQLHSKTQAESHLENENAWLKEEMVRISQELNSTHDTAVAQLRERYTSQSAILQEQMHILENQVSTQCDELCAAKNCFAEANVTVQRLSEELQDAQGEIEELRHSLEVRDNAISDLQSNLQEAQEESTRLKIQGKEVEAKQVSLGARARELERSKADLLQQCRLQERALENAMKAEQRVLAIFQSHRQPVSSTTAVAATMNPSQDGRISVQGLPELGILSEDDEDYSEMMKDA